MRAFANGQILAGQVFRGLRMVGVPDGTSRQFNMSGRGKVLSLPGTIFEGESKSEGLIRYPVYDKGQVDSYYCEDKPSGTLLTDAESSKALEESIYSKGDKIVFAAVTPAPKFAWAEPPYFMDLEMCYIEPIGVDPRYVVALLNSSLMTFWFVHGAKKFDNGLFGIDEGTIAEAPLAYEPRLGSLLIKLSNEASNLKKARRGYLDIWKNYSDYMKTGSIRLRELLSEDAQKVEGNPVHWGFTTMALPGSPRREKEFKFDFLTAQPDPEGGNISISGIRSASSEWLMDMRFASRELLMYVYCALNDPYSARPRTVEEMLETSIPVILPDHPRRTLEIWKAVMWDFRNYVSAERLKPHDFRAFDGEPLSIPRELPPIERQLERTLANIDLVVFRIYGISNEQAKAVMEALPMFCPQRDRVMDYLSKADLQTSLEEILRAESTETVDAGGLVSSHGDEHKHHGGNCRCDGERKI